MSQHQSLLLPDALAGTLFGAGLVPGYPHQPPTHKYSLRSPLFAPNFPQNPGGISAPIRGAVKVGWGEGVPPGIYAQTV